MNSQPKAEVRAHAKAVRAAMSPDLRAEYDARIVERCQSELDWQDYERVMVFLPIARNHEINTWPLVRWIWATWPAVAVYVPVVQGERLVAAHITPLSTFKSSVLGIPEPVDVVELGRRDDLDVIITPLLGFDEFGQRVGYGRGYYDRYFATRPQALRVGLGYESLKVAGGIAAETFDQPLELVITEQAVHKTKQPR